MCASASTTACEPLAMAGDSCRPPAPCQHSPPSAIIGGVRETPWIVPVVAGLFGAVVGSFLNVVIHRLPAGEPIRPWDNVPVLGWLALRGHCRDCREPISPRYPLVELANALLWAALALRVGPGLHFLALAAFCSALL